RDEEVGIAVVVDVGECATHGDLIRHGQPGSGGDVHEPTTAEVLPELVGAELREEIEIGEAVAIDVGRAQAAAVVVVSQLVRLARHPRTPENWAMPALAPDQVYQLLRNLTSPVVAITCQRAGTRNGMIADSAIRASIVPAIPRVSVYIHKFNFSHDLIFETGRFVLHLLRDDQFELIHRLGFASGRTRDKLAGLPHRPGTLRPPVLDHC